MNDAAKEEMKKEVVEFVKSQPGYDESMQESMQAFSDEKGNLVIYGKDEMSGIMGVGETPSIAFRDFVRSWKQLNGFKWIEKHR